VRRNIVLHRVWAILAGFILTVAGASAQTIAYRQTNLLSDVPGSANHMNPALQDPWGIAIAPGRAFFVADNDNGRVIAPDATGGGVAPVGFNIQNPARTGFAVPTGIISDPASIFATNARHTRPSHSDPVTDRLKFVLFRRVYTGRVASSALSVAHDLNDARTSRNDSPVLPQTSLTVAGVLGNRIKGPRTFGKNIQKESGG